MPDHPWTIPGDLDLGAAATAATVDDVARLLKGFELPAPDDADAEPYGPLGVLAASFETAVREFEFYDLNEAVCLVSSLTVRRMQGEMLDLARALARAGGREGNLGYAERRAAEIAGDAGRRFEALADDAFGDADDWASLLIEALATALGGMVIVDAWSAGSWDPAEVDRNDYVYRVAGPILVAHYPGHAHERALTADGVSDAIARLATDPIGFAERAGVLYDDDEAFDQAVTLSGLAATGSASRIELVSLPVVTDALLFSATETQHDGLDMVVAAIDGIVVGDTSLAARIGLVDP